MSWRFPYLDRLTILYCTTFFGCGCLVVQQLNNNRVTGTNQSRKMHIIFVDREKKWWLCFQTERFQSNRKLSLSFFNSDWSWIHLWNSKMYATPKCHHFCNWIHHHFWKKSFQKIQKVKCILKVSRQLSYQQPLINYIILVFT